MSDERIPFESHEEGASSRADTLPDETVLIGYQHPDDVLSDPRLDKDGKRMLLAAFASDAHAVEGLPALRQLPSGAIVPVDEILDALRVLDHADGDARTAVTRLWRSRAPRRRPRGGPRLRVFPIHRDDDEDPPPRPAAAARHAAILGAMAA